MQLHGRRCVGISLYIIRVMRLKERWRQFKLQTKGSKILKSLRRALFEKSHLSPYLPMMREQLPDKLIRIYEDQSYSHSSTADIAQSKHPQHKQAKRGQWVADFFLRSKECVNPIILTLLAWYGLVGFAIITTYFTTTMTLVYGLQAWIDLSTDPFTTLLSAFCVLIFLGDILVQLSAGFLSRGMIVVDRERAVRRYLRSFLVVDGLLVVILTLALASGEYYTNIPKMLIVLKFGRVFEIDGLFMRRLSTSPNARAGYVISKQLVTIFVIAHTLGILFYAIDFALTQDPICINDNALCWLYSSTAYSPIMAFGWRLRYFYSLYWGINTICMISYGDIAPNNPQETTFALACFCFSFLTYGYVVNNIIKVMLDARNSRDNYRAELVLYTTYMKHLAISQNHQYDFRDYLESQYFEERDRRHAVEEEMKGRLPVDLREELLKSAYHRLYEGLQFVLFSSPSLVKLLYLLQERRFTRGETILAQGAPLAQLIYLQKGQLQLTCARYQRIHQIITICTPDEFVALYQLILNERAAFTVRTANTSTLYFLSRDKMEEELHRFTDLRQNWKVVRDQLRFGSNYERIFYRCYFCGANHHWYRCPDHLPNFSNVNLARHSRLELPGRITCSRYNAWRDRERLNGIQVWRVRVKDEVLRKIEERVHELKAVKQAWRSGFDVDVHHEWEYYKPQHNLSRFKEEWNNSKQKRRQSQKKEQEQPPLPLDLGGLFSFANPL